MQLSGNIVPPLRDILKRQLKCKKQLVSTLVALTNSPEAEVIEMLDATTNEHDASKDFGADPNLAGETAHAEITEESLFVDPRLWARQGVWLYGLRLPDFSVVERCRIQFRCS